MLEVEIHPDPALDENRAGRGTEGNGNKRLASECTPAEQGQGFATFTGTLDREEMSELSDISTESIATKRSPTDNTRMQGVTEKTATSSSFSHQVKNTMGNFFPTFMGTSTGDEVETRKEEENDDDQDDLVSQLSLNSSTRENGAPTNRETGFSDQLGVVRTINKTIYGSQQSREFATMTNLEVQPGKNRSTGPSKPPTEPEADFEETSRQRGKIRVSSSTKLPGTNRVTPPLMTLLVDEWASIEEALTSIVDSIGEQNENMSLRVSELERAVHIERESLREEINRNRQEVSRSEKRLKERTDEH